MKGREAVEGGMLWDGTKDGVWCGILLPAYVTGRRDAAEDVDDSFER